MVENFINHRCRAPLVNRQSSIDGQAITFLGISDTIYNNPNNRPVMMVRQGEFPKVDPVDAEIFAA